MSDKKQKLPNWKQWAGEKFLDWYDRNKPEDLQLPLLRTTEEWNTWGETIYRPWYSSQVETQDSNPTDPPPPPPGPIKP